MLTNFLEHLFRFPWSQERASVIPFKRTLTVNQPVNPGAARHKFTADCDPTSIFIISEIVTLMTPNNWS